MLENLVGVVWVSRAGGTQQCLTLQLHARMLRRSEPAQLTTHAREKAWAAETPSRLAHATHVSWV